MSEAESKAFSHNGVEFAIVGAGAVMSYGGVEYSVVKPPRLDTYSTFTRYLAGTAESLLRHLRDIERAEIEVRNARSSFERAIVEWAK